jgi:hypothetical protein
MLQIRKAERKQAKLRLGIAATSGAGKTYGALLIAFGLGGKVGMIDTEHGSGDLYAHMGEYDIINIEAPYTVTKYLEAIKAFEQTGYSTIIIDSLTHAWAGDGGLLDKQGKIADRGTNSFAAWRTITPEHNALVEAQLKSPCHIISTMRSKQDYVLEVNDKGKQTPKKVGLAPVQRDGMEYEFTIMLDIDQNHIATSTKDRTGLFDGQFFKIDNTIGKKLLEWLNTGNAVQPQQQQPMQQLQQQPQSQPTQQLPAEAIEAYIAHFLQNPSFTDGSVKKQMQQWNYVWETPAIEKQFFDRWHTAQKAEIERRNSASAANDLQGDYQVEDGRVTP